MSCKTGSSSVMLWKNFLTSDCDTSPVVQAACVSRHWLSYTHQTQPQLAFVQASQLHIQQLTHIST